MRFTRIDDLEVVTRITGPTHHLLGMALSPAPTAGTPILERVSLARPQPEVEPFDPDRDLCREILAGVSEANDRLGTHVGVTRVRYCADDPPIPGVYHRLAQALVAHVTAGPVEEAPTGMSLAPTNGIHDPLASERV